MEQKENSSNKPNQSDNYGYNSTSTNPFVGSLNLPVINLPDLDAIPQPSSMPFSNPNPTSFAQLSNANSSTATSLSANIYSHTLSEYGPLIVTDNSNRQKDNPILTPDFIVTPTVSSTPMGPLLINSEPEFTGLNSNPSLPVDKPTSSSSTTMPTNSATTTSNVTNRNTETTKSDRQIDIRDCLLYSPPPSNDWEGPNLNPNSGRPMESDGRIPRKGGDHNDYNNEQSFLGMQKLYRSYEAQIKTEKDKADILELEINTLVRSYRGQSLDLDPVFCRKRDDKKRIEAEMERLEGQLKKLENRIYTNHNYRITREVSNRRSGPIPSANYVSKRARMSTAQVSEVSTNKNNEKKDILLALKDTNTWCHTCNVHLNSVRELARHLHGAEHRAEMKNKKSTPWRSNKQLDKTDRRKSYNTMKSICAKLTNENDRSFTLNDVDRILNPLVDPKDRSFKQRVLARERGQFDEDDPLFKVRGYDMIWPIDGYYCQLCNKALCDAHELENHLQSYEHVYSHFKFMALNSEQERELRKKFIRSYERQFPPVEERRSRSTTRPSSTDIASTNDRENRTHQSNAPFRYKKPTSKIVDEHEVLKGRTSVDHGRKLPHVEPRRPRSTSPIAPKSSNITNKRVFESSVPEIQPLSRKEPTALKRLRTTKLVTAEKEPMYQASVDKELPSIHLEDISSSEESEKEEDQAKDSSQDVQVIEQVVLEPGDIDSPFPELQLSSSGNQHKDVLKDKRLASQCKVLLPMLNLDDYRHLMDNDGGQGMWTRINACMAKKEKYNRPNVSIKTEKDNIFGRSNTVANYELLDGQQETVDISGQIETNEASKIPEKEKRDEKDSSVVETDKVMHTFSDAEDNDQEKDPNEYKKYMGMLEEFFFEK